MSPSNGFLFAAVVVWLLVHLHCYIISWLGLCQSGQALIARPQHTCTAQIPGTPVAPPRLQRISFEWTSVTGLLLLCARIHVLSDFPFTKSPLNTAWAETLLSNESNANDLIMDLEREYTGKSNPEPQLNLSSREEAWNVWFKYN
jgi:hypothetical protein